jgi:hypothetical protein
VKLAKFVHRVLAGSVLTANDPVEAVVRESHELAPAGRMSSLNLTGAALPLRAHWGTLDVLAAAGNDRRRVVLSHNTRAHDDRKQKPGSAAVSLSQRNGRSGLVGSSGIAACRFWSSSNPTSRDDQPACLLGRAVDELWRVSRQPTAVPPGEKMARSGVDPHQAQM